MCLPSILGHPSLQEVLLSASLRPPAAHEGVLHRLVQPKPLPNTGQEVPTRTGVTAELHKVQNCLIAGFVHQNIALKST